MEHKSILNKKQEFNSSEEAEDFVFLTPDEKIVKSIIVSQLSNTSIQVTYQGNVIPVAKFRELNVVKEQIKTKFQGYCTDTDSDNLECMDYDDYSITYRLNFSKC